MGTIVKIVLVGAGSASFGRGMLPDLLAEPSLNPDDTEVWLMDTNEEALGLMSAAASRLGRETGSAIRFLATPHRDEALPGADFVIIAVSVQRMKL